MATSETEIANLALSHLGIGKEIANLDTERSVESLTCRRFYDHARDQVLRSFAWPFASKISTLGLVAENPNTEWAYSYRYPSDCLMFRRILSGTRNDGISTRIRYVISQDDDGLVIYTDEQNAQAEYTFKVLDVLRYPVDFVTALSFLLAHYIAPRITSGDRFKLGARALELYQFEVSKARALALNENVFDQMPESDFIVARE